ncbi:MAG: HAMP domain-containing protein [Bacteroidetes bacterium]|nr:HAMP domain-containing protein [Bacteroidota bacterium]MCW5896518.1 HAMP domain-containing protein [Bacteroidota bacterium]
MRRIQTKITLTYVLLTLCAFAALAVIASLTTESYLTNRKTAELSERIDVLSSLLKSDTHAGTLHHRIKTLTLATNFRITLVDGAGVVLADSDVPPDSTGRIKNHLSRPEIQQSMRGEVGSDARRSSTVNQDFLYVAKSVDFTGAEGELANVKVFRLSAHLEDITTMIREERFNIMIAGVVVLVLVIGISLFLSRRLATPMERIAGAVEQIRSGNLDTRIEVTGNDEVGRVARAVNEMVEKLKSDIVQLRKLERVRSEFLGNVSHELRTPIFSLQGFLETLLEGAIDDTTVNRDFVQKAYNHSVRLNTLLGDLITISHIESGEMKMSFRYFNLNELLSSVIEEFTPTAENNKVSLRLAPNLPADVEVLGDKERLHVVFDNLLENAIKYNKPGGDVVVSFERHDGKVRLSVADTGVGIAAEHQPRIFERFYRVDRNRSREVGGTGLGLAIVKHIIEAHGSSVQIQSTVGKGSVFSFTLKTA